MTDPAPLRTYLSGAPAEVSVDADMRLRSVQAPPDEVTIGEFGVHTESFDIEDYLVIAGVPAGQAMCEVRMRSRSVMGEYIFTDVPPAPADIDIKATCRWLPTAASFSPDGQSWSPTFGGGLTLATDGPAPYLDDTYSFEVRGGDEVSLPAVIFDGDASIALSAQGWSAPAFTFILVAVMHPNPEGAVYGLFASRLPEQISSDDSTDITGSRPVEWSLRNRQGTIELDAGGTMLAHQTFVEQGRPTMVAITLDGSGGKLFVADRSKSSRSFSTANFALYEIDLLLGATGSGAANETAYMDVLDFSYFDRALSFDELADVLHQMDSCYGIVG